MNSGIFGLQGNEGQLHFPFTSSPRVTEPPAITHPLPEAELRDAFVGTPVTKFSQKCSRYSRCTERIFQQGVAPHVYISVCVCVCVFSVFAAKCSVCT